MPLPTLHLTPHDVRRTARGESGGYLSFPQDLHPLHLHQLARRTRMLHIAIPGRPTFLLTPGRMHLSMSGKIRSRKASCEYKCWSPIRSAGKSSRHLMSSSISSMRTSPRSSCGLRRFLMPCLAKIARILQNIRQNRHSCMASTSIYLLYSSLSITSAFSG